MGVGKRRNVCFNQSFKCALINLLHVDCSQKRRRFRWLGGGKQISARSQILVMRSLGMLGTASCEKVSRVEASSLTAT